MIQDAAFAVWNSSIKTFEKFSINTLHMAPLTFLTICAFIGSLLLCFVSCHIIIDYRYLYKILLYSTIWNLSVLLYPAPLLLSLLFEEFQTQ